MSSEDEHGTVDLVRVVDQESSFRIRVLGRQAPGVLPLHDSLDAEILVETSFVHGHLRIGFSPRHLERWAQCLVALRAGQDIGWLDQGNGPTVRVEWPEDNDEIILVRVEDATGSGATVDVPLAVEEGWLDEQDALLAGVRQAWPSEVRETSPGAYEWRHR
ncbi:DUF5959 family protein [Streptomyces sp. NPDC049915]|uniref:DUF5959 family protein n=1 Tax=Streptomyces sp. NPDC049915 TaxID=3155510 RepID=UPI00341B83DD